MHKNTIKYYSCQSTVRQVVNVSGAASTRKPLVLYANNEETKNVLYQMLYFDLISSVDLAHIEANICFPMSVVDSDSKHFGQQQDTLCDLGLWQQQRQQQQCGGGDEKK